MKLTERQLRNFFAKVRFGRCWLWKGQLTDRGYAFVRIGSRMRKAHTVAHEIFIGVLPEGFEPDHVCRVRRCINPFHIEPVTHAENMRRASGPRMKVCRRGHIMNRANTYEWVRPSGMIHRQCRKCAAWRQRKRG